MKQFADLSRGDSVFLPDGQSIGHVTEAGADRVVLDLKLGLGYIHTLVGGAVKCHTTNVLGFRVKASRL